ncbi:hypothetical protein ABT158_00805 [Nonomuraea sp. NPDC001636]|uniref:hypothetical protein n=1 Tax=Nonomuraea sp. NPDC001636 TaxID=3154391 RepID=UPI00331E2C66
MSNTPDIKPRREAPQYLRPGFRPSREGDLRQALDHIAGSPAHAEFRRFSG